MNVEIIKKDIDDSYNFVYKDLSSTETVLNCNAKIIVFWTFEDYTIGVPNEAYFAFTSNFVYDIKDFKVFDILLRPVVV